MRLLWLALSLWLAPPARAAQTAQAPRLIVPGQEARTGCASCGLVLPSGLSAPSAPQLAPSAAAAAAPGGAILLDLSARFAPPEAGKPAPDAASLLPELFDHSSDGSRIGPQLVTPETIAREPELLARQAALAQAVRRATPALAESVRRGAWNGPGTTLEKPCCGDAAPKLGLLLRQMGWSVHVIEAEFHYFLLHSVEAGQLIIDPTIRQFFGGPRAPPTVPTVFVGTPTELHRLFEAHASAKTTRYGADRIYFREAAVRDARLNDVRGALLSRPPAEDAAPLLSFLERLRRDLSYFLSRA